jgi:hypothetical protein
MPEVTGRPSKPPGTLWLLRLLVERSAAERAARPISDALSEPKPQTAQATDPRHADLLSPERAVCDGAAIRSFVH